MPSKEVMAVTKSFALTRVNVLVGRVFVISSVFTALETVLNALGQNQLEGHPFLVGTLAALVFVQVANLINFWFLSGSKVWYRLQVGLVLVTTLLWPIFYAGPHEQDSKPWVWWALGMAGLAAHLGFRTWIGAAVIALLPISWFFIRISESGGSGDWQSALQDSIYTLLFSAAISSLVALLQNAAAKVDLENHRATVLAAEQARTDAIERERARVDALIHDKVLTTLLVAANAKSAADYSASSDLAASAIRALTSTETFTTSATTASSLFLSLREAIGRQASSIKVNLETSDDQPVDEQVALALSEATIQAVANILQHAGNDVSGKVILKSNQRGIKIVVRDDGRGFRMNRIPKNRLGLRLSIIARVESVGGRVFIDSEVGRGTNVIIEWNAR